MSVVQKELKSVKKKVPQMSSSHILGVLASQHSNDVFVSECKDGPSWFGGHARMDAWVMNRSWSRLCFTGYEVKVSRADFKQDEKWHSYLGSCNQLYFVCPKGLIDPSEVPGDVGLKYCTENRAMTVKKAAHRECVPPMELFCYILMCRTRIVPPRHFEPPTKQERIEGYRKWLDEKKESRKLGHILRSEVAWQMDRIQSDNEALKSKIEKLELVRTFANEIGITNWDGEEEMKRKVQDFKSKVPQEYLQKLREVRTETENLIKLFDP